MNTHKIKNNSNQLPESVQEQKRQAKSRKGIYKENNEITLGACVQDIVKKLEPPNQQEKEKKEKF